VVGKNEKMVVFRGDESHEIESVKITQKAKQNKGIV